jgi:hypothetical protein
MMLKNLAMFYYSEIFKTQADDVKSVIINRSIHGLSELFEHYRIALQFPYTTVTNFNAFRDVMEELEWVSENEIRIYHDSLPSLDEQELGIYIDFLNLIDVEWEKYEERAEITRKYHEKTRDVIPEDAWINTKPKVFNVFFHQEDESLINEIMKKYSRNYRDSIFYDEKGIEHFMTYLKFKYSKTTNQKGKKSFFSRALWKLLSFILPVANPDFECLYDLVGTWYIEYNETYSIDGTNREVGKDVKGRVIVKAPDDKNYGFWNDTNMGLKDFIETFNAERISKDEFEAVWNEELVKIDR